MNATVRFLSIEPLLEDLGKMNVTDIHWVIVGGESGPKARPMKQEWVESVQVQCGEQAAAFFFKQWGGWGADGKRRAKKSNARLINRPATSAGKYVISQHHTWPGAVAT